MSVEVERMPKQGSQKPEKATANAQAHAEALAELMAEKSRRKEAEAKLAEALASKAHKVREEFSEI